MVLPWKTDCTARTDQTPGAQTATNVSPIELVWKGIVSGDLWSLDAKVPLTDVHTALDDDDNEPWYARFECEQAWISAMFFSAVGLYSVLRKRWPRWSRNFGLVYMIISMLCVVAGFLLLEYEVGQGSNVDRSLFNSMVFPGTPVSDVKMPQVTVWAWLAVVAHGIAAVVLTVILVRNLVFSPRPRNKAPCQVSAVGNHGR
jgi:hypothetical protein